MGGGSDNAQRQAESRERETTARINANSGRVNAIFDAPERQAQIADFTEAVRAQYREELDRQKLNNDQQLKFAFARSGQTGGSLAKDKYVESGEKYNRGVIESDRLAQGQAANLRASDEDSRSRLLALVQSGGDIGTASSNAATQLQNNLLAGRSSTNVGELGNAFSTFSDIFSRSKQQSEYRRGLMDYQNLYAPTFGFGGNSGGQR